VEQGELGNRNAVPIDVLVFGTFIKQIFPVDACKWSKISIKI
jgi:hypothetical protein